jgi:hypothetical protein
LEKKGENWIKVWLYNRPEYRISAVNPNLYMERFYKFMKENVIINQTEKLIYGERDSGIKSFIESDLNKSKQT